MLTSSPTGRLLLTITGVQYTAPGCPIRLPSYPPHSFGSGGWASPGEVICKQKSRVVGWENIYCQYFTLYFSLLLLSIIFTHFKIFWILEHQKINFRIHTFFLHACLLCNEWLLGLHTWMGYYDIMNGYILGLHTWYWDIMILWVAKYSSCPPDGNIVTFNPKIATIDPTMSWKREYWK